MKNFILNLLIVGSLLYIIYIICRTCIDAWGSFFLDMDTSTVILIKLAEAGFIGFILLCFSSGKNNNDDEKK